MIKQWTTAEVFVLDVSENPFHIIQKFGTKAKDKTIINYFLTWQQCHYLVYKDFFFGGRITYKHLDMIYLTSLVFCIINEIERITVIGNN